MNRIQTDTQHEIVRQLVMAASTAALYAIDHPQVIRLCNAAHSSIKAAMGSEAEIVMLAIGDELIMAEIPMKGSYYSEKLARLLKARGIGHLKILQPVTLAEIRQLIVTISRVRPGGVDARSSENIRYGTVEVRHSDVTGRDIAGFEDLLEDELATLVNTFERIAERQPFEVSGITSIVSGFVGAIRNNFNPLLALVPLRQMDEYTFTHSLDVCVLNLVQGMSLGIEGQLLTEIGLAGMLHDVGKIFMNASILNKPAKLDDAEMAHMQQHPRRGAEYLLSCPGIPRLAVLSSFEHHMQYSLAGYPSMHSDWQLALPSQMTMISDIFDALRTRRVYQTPKDFERIESLLLEKAGVELNPSLTRNFLKVMKRLSVEL
ncbi:MAG: HD domain-containing protein [Geobacteraceae bacterium]|nr:HD domain-containing protein [Geobacteraceae bacterium]